VTPNLPTTVRERMKTTAMPVVYEEACRALVACVTIDEAAYWDNKADALAAWAKIYKSDEAAVAAKRLKLHAYRRIGALAREINSSVPSPNDRRSGTPKILRENGFSKGQIDQIRVVGSLSDSAFQEIINRTSVPAPTQIPRLSMTEAWRTWQHSSGIGQVRAFVRRTSAKELARKMTTSEANAARLTIVEIQEWLDEFDQHLPKDTK
jgi:hypothetical protein